MLPNLLLQIGPLPVYTFGVILAVTFVLGVFLFWRAATREGFASDPVFDLIFLSVLAALVSGRLSFILLTGDPPLTDLPAFGGAILCVGEGIFWAPAFLFGLAVFYLCTRRRKEWSFFKLADLAVPVLALGQGIGFLGAELTGYLSSAIGLWLVGIGFLGLFFILKLAKRKVARSGVASLLPFHFVQSGVIFSGYLFIAGILTAFAEYVGEAKAVAFGIDLNYLLGLGLLTTGALGLFWRSGFFALMLGKVEKQLRFKLKIR